MIAKEIYESALALDISRMDDDREMEFFALRLLNLLLRETKIHNDFIRVKKGRARLETAPKANSLADDIGFEEEMFSPLVYGLAAKLLAAQQELTLASLYNGQYLTLLEMATPYINMEEGNV